MALELPRVVVAVPDGDLAGGERLRHLLGRQVADVEHDRRRAVARVAVERHAVDGAQPVERAPQQLVLVRAHRVEADLAHVRGGGGHAREALERQRPQLPAVRHLVGRRHQLVRWQLRQQVRRRAQDAHVRPEPLVRRAREDVGAEGAQIERPVRCGVDGVDVDARAGAARRRDDPGEVGHRAAGVGRRRDRHPAGPLAQHRLDRGRRQLEALRVGVGEADGRARALRRDHPRPDVGVVVEARADDLVAGPELPPRGGGEAHGQGRHARAEDDAGRLRAEQPGHLGARRRHGLVGGVGGGEDSAVVGVAPGAHEVRHGVDGGIDHLGAGGAVEPGPAAGQAWEAIAIHAINSSACRSSVRSGS